MDIEIYKYICSIVSLLSSKYNHFRRPINSQILKMNVPVWQVQRVPIAKCTLNPERRVVSHEIIKKDTTVTDYGGS